MATQSNVNVIRDVYAAFGRGDVPAVLNLLDPKADLEFEAPASVPWAGERRGREGWIQFFQTLAENLDDIRLAMEPFAAEGDHVVMTGRYEGTVRSTGKRIDSPLVHLWTVRNGLVVKCVEMTNTAHEVAACAPASSPLQTVERIYTAFQSGDIPFIVAQVAPDVFWRQPANVPWGGDYVGQGQVGAFFAKLNEVVETTGFEVEENIDAGNEVVTYGYYSSRNRSTGKSSRSRFVFRWSFDNGKVRRYEAVLDSAPIVAAATA